MKETTHFSALVSTACLSFLFWDVGDLVCAGRSGGTGNAVDFLFVLGWTNGCPEGLLRVGVLGLVSKHTFFLAQGNNPLSGTGSYSLAILSVLWC